MIKDYFIKQGIKDVEIEKFIRTQFPYGDYSKTELQRTPLGIKIIIYTNKPGRIIGRGGKNINEITEMVKEKFGFENPQIDVKAVRNPDLDPKIVAKQIASAIERGYNYKKIGNLVMKRVMDAGAVGVEIIISGRLGGGGGKSMTGKFTHGYLKHCGQPAKDFVSRGFEEANTRPGKVGIKVAIMKEYVDISGKKRELLEQKIEAEEESGVREEKPKEEKKHKKPEEKGKARARKDSKKKERKPARKTEKKAREKKSTRTSRTKKTTKPGRTAGKGK